MHKAAVLLALYNNARFQGKAFDTQPIMKVVGKMALPGTIEKAKAEIEKCSKNNNYYFDYIDLGGGSKPLKVNLAGFDFDPNQYDNYHGSEGYAEKIVAQLRSEVISQFKDVVSQKSSDNKKEDDKSASASVKQADTVSQKPKPAVTLSGSAHRGKFTFIGQASSAFTMNDNASIENAAVVDTTHMTEAQQLTAALDAINNIKFS